MNGERTQIVDIEDNPHPSHSGYKLTRVVFSNGDALDVEVEHGGGISLKVKCKSPGPSISVLSPHTSGNSSNQRRTDH